MVLLTYSDINALGVMRLAVCASVNTKKKLGDEIITFF